MGQEAVGKIAVVTGANRGMGLEACRQLAQCGAEVILTSRDLAEGEAAAKALRDEGLNVTARQLDVTNKASIAALVDDIERDHGRIDILINNAGTTGRGGAFQTDPADVRAVFETNLIGPLMLCQALIPVMQGDGRVVNVSSDLAQLTDMGGGQAGYRISKTALNALTCIFAAETKSKNIKVNAMSPGWVRTDMGGASAPRSAAEGVATMIWLATLPDDGPSGGFFRDQQLIPW